MNILILYSHFDAKAATKIAHALKDAGETVFSKHDATHMPHVPGLLEIPLNTMVRAILTHSTALIVWAGETAEVVRLGSLKFRSIRLSPDAGLAFVSTRRSRFRH